MYLGSVSILTNPMPIHPLALAALLTSPLAAQDPAPTRTVKQILDRATPCVALVQVFDASGDLVSQGTGFLIAPGFVATNHHVVEGATEVKVKMTGLARGLPAVGMIASDETADLAVLAVPSLPRTSTLLLADDAPEIGDPVFVIGNPLGLEGTVSAGMVSARRTLDDLELFQLTAPISPGSSGSPVLDRSGQVIGIATGSKEGGQNLNFAVPAARLQFIWENRIHITGFAPDQTNGLSAPRPHDDAGRLDFERIEEGEASLTALKDFLDDLGASTGYFSDETIFVRWDVIGDEMEEVFLIACKGRISDEVQYLEIAQLFELQENVIGNTYRENRLLDLLDETEPGLFQLGILGQNVIAIQNAPVVEPLSGQALERILMGFDLSTTIWMVANLEDLTDYLEF